MPLSILEQLQLLSDKVDSPERLAMFQAFGIEKFADAAVFNLFRHALIELFTNGGGGGTFNQDNKVKVIPFSYSDSSTEQQILNNINGLGAYTVAEDELVVFKGRNLFNANVKKYMMTGVGKGNYGNGGTQLAMANIELFFNSVATIADVEREDSTQDINFGDINSLTISQWLNALTDPIMLQAQNEGYVLFKGTIDGNAKAYLWKAGAGTYGSGHLQSIDENFQIVENTVPPALQDLQQILQVNSIAVTDDTVSIKVEGDNGSYSRLDIIRGGSFVWNTQDENGYVSSIGMGNGGYNQYGVGTFFSYFGYGYQFITEEGEIKFSGSDTFNGIQYDQDYSGNYTDRSLVDKAYVDGVTVTPTVQQTIDQNPNITTEVYYVQPGQDFLTTAWGFRINAKGFEIIRRAAGQLVETTSMGTNSILFNRPSENKRGRLQFNPNSPVVGESEVPTWLTPLTPGTLITDTDLKAALTSKLLASSSVDGPALTGTVSQSILATYFIPANSIGNGLLDIMAKYEKSGVAGTAELRIVKNIVPNLSAGFTQIARVSHTATTLYGPIYRTFEIKDNTIQGWSFGTSGITDNVISTLARSTSSFDTTVDQYVMIVGVLANAADSMKQTAFKMTYNKNF
jgi:hypothetical protein